MIDLKLLAEFSGDDKPYVVKVVDDGTSVTAMEIDERDRAQVSARETAAVSLESAHGKMTLFAKEDDPIDGDVLLCLPTQGVVQRLFRRASRHNTILFTERCDQLCVMCSQPPKNKEYRWLFTHYEKAMGLFDHGAMIGISGGEPTLYKDELLGAMERVSERRPDLSFHILTNGQHFAMEDRERLITLHERAHLVWGIPLYSHVADTHDEIVGKNGAYNKVLENLFLLASAKGQIELRTVITALNFLDVPHLAVFVGKHIPFVIDWAIMGMEPIGYAKANKDRLFIDHTAHPVPLMNAIEISVAQGTPCHLYNIPLCTMPDAYRDNCVDSIADWKKKFLPECDPCRLKGHCPGFFEWYSDAWEWSGVQPVL